MTKTSMILSLIRSEPVRQSIVKIAEGADWEAIFRVCKNARLAPFIYKRILSRNLAATVPEEILSSFKKEYAIWCATNLKITNHLQLLLTQLNENGVDCVVLKGAALIDVVYEDIGTRPMADVDILIREGDLASADTLLAKLGYQRIRQTSGDQESWQLRGCWELALPDDPTSAIDVHWELINKRTLKDHVTIDVDELWSRACGQKVCGANTLVLSPEDHILYSCVHTVLHHNFSSARSFVDIYKLVEVYSESLDWEALAAAARSNHSAKIVRLVMECVRDWLEAPIPDRFFRSLGHPFSVLDRLWLSPQTDPAWVLGTATDELRRGPRQNVQRILYQLSLVETVGDRLKVLADHCLPSRERIEKTYRVRSNVRFLLYPVHIMLVTIGLVGVAALTVGRLFRRGTAHCRGGSDGKS